MFLVEYRDPDSLPNPLHDQRLDQSSSSKVVLSGGLRCCYCLGFAMESFVYILTESRNLDHLLVENQTLVITFPPRHRALYDAIEQVVRTFS